MLVAGAVAGGGLTVIANAPNPAGVALLKRGFADESIGAGGLLLGAAGPTAVAAWRSCSCERSAALGNMRSWRSKRRAAWAGVFPIRTKGTRHGTLFRYAVTHEYEQSSITF